MTCDLTSLVCDVGSQVLVLRLEKEREDALEAVKRLEGEAAKSKEAGY